MSSPVLNIDYLNFSKSGLLLKAKVVDHEI